MGRRGKRERLSPEERDQVAEGLREVHEAVVALGRAVFRLEARLELVPPLRLGLEERQALHRRLYPDGLPVVEGEVLTRP